MPLLLDQLGAGQRAALAGLAGLCLLGLFGVAAVRRVRNRAQEQA